MRRILVIHCPTERSTPGNSFGPIAINATTPITTSSLQPMSNMEYLTPSGAGLTARAPEPCGRRPSVSPRLGRWTAAATASGRSARLAALGLRCGGALRRLVIDRLRVRRRFGLGGLVLRHALLERLDALGDVAHQLGNLAAPEQQQHDGDDDDPVPDTQGTHRYILRTDGSNGDAPASGFSARN